MRYIVIPVVIVLIVLLFVSVFGCSKGGGVMPEILDGDGMVYIDSDYRTDYANVLYNDDNADEHNGDYFAVAYLGKGDIGRENVTKRIDAVFGGVLSKELVDSIEHLDFGGDEYFLVIPRYKDSYKVFPQGEEHKNTVFFNSGEPFTINCSGAIIEYFSFGGLKFALKADENGGINIDGVWDITAY